MSKRILFVLVVLLLHIPLFAYPVLRLCDWLGLSGWLTTAIFIPLFFSQVIARVYLRHANSGWVFWLRRAADLWLGISPLEVGLLLLAEVLVFLVMHRLLPRFGAKTLLLYSRCQRLGTPPLLHPRNRVELRGLGR